jgi:4-amino-4-deoxy-L-arabinose transferase-like glycosyltransferase
VRGRRGDRRLAGLFVLGGWFLVELLTLDFSAGIVHPYYASALGPGVAAMVGAGAVAIGSLVRSSSKRGWRCAALCWRYWRWRARSLSSCC